MHEQPVTASLADIAGAEYVAAAARARAFLNGEDAEALLALAHEPVEFLPASFMARQHTLLAQVGKPVIAPTADTANGASSRMFTAASKRAQAPLSAAGLFRVGEDGRLRFISKSEHYHTPLGHDFPGYALLNTARRLGIPNATHNSTRGHITRLLEEELVRLADSAGLDRVLNLETGSLAVEAALKMILARFYAPEPNSPPPPYQGRAPVLLVMGNDDGGLQANYHGTTILTQTMRGMWPDLHGFIPVCPIRPNSLEDLEAAFARWNSGETKIAGFFHEIVMMNYGGRLLSREFLQRAYALCRAHDVPTVCDEIQSCLWNSEIFMFREWGLAPNFVALGKGFPGGEYPASRLLFSADMDTLPLFGALVTNGQEELASLAYLITMRWATANAGFTRYVGDYYEGRLRDLMRKYPQTITAVEGRRHMMSLHFANLESAKNFAACLNEAGLDISAQVYKADCPPAVLTKLPLICSLTVIDFVLDRMESAL